jgi:hypothetical protein
LQVALRMLFGDTIFGRKSAEQPILMDIDAAHQLKSRYQSSINAHFSNIRSICGVELNFFNSLLILVCSTNSITFDAARPSAPACDFAPL